MKHWKWPSSSSSSLSPSSSLFNIDSMFAQISPDCSGCGTCKAFSNGVGAMLVEGNVWFQSSFLTYFLDNIIWRDIWQYWFMSISIKTNCLELPCLVCWGINNVPRFMSRTQPFPYGTTGPLPMRRLKKINSMANFFHAYMQGMAVR